MRISLIIPTAYTPEPYFGDCMQRVKEETLKGDFEVIISEDGNVTDEMRAKYPENAIVLKHPEPSGCGQARKRAQEICTGDIVCFLDSDDLMARGYYDLVVDAFKKHPEASCIEFGFNNVNLNGCIETIFPDGIDQTYGNFSYEMAWNKAYKGENVRKATPFYNPPLMMTPAEDLLWNTVYQSKFNEPYISEKKLLLDRIVRRQGLAHSTAADVKNRIKMMEYSMEVAKTISTSAPIYMWILQYVENLKNSLLKGTTHCGGYRWNTWQIIPVKNNSPVTFHLLHECTAKCPYCVNAKFGKFVKDGTGIDSKHIAEKLNAAIDKWDKLYGLPHSVTLSGGEPTLIDPEEMRVVFESHPETLFIMFTNGYNLKNWIDRFDNVIFRIHSIDGKINPLWLTSDKVQTYCYVGEPDDPVFKAWAEMKKKWPKLMTFTNILNRTNPSEEEHKLCRQVEGVWCVDVSVEGEPLVSPCCGFNNGVHGTIENRPLKANIDCSNCCNAPDNYSEV